MLGGGRDGGRDGGREGWKDGRRGGRSLGRFHDRSHGRGRRKKFELLILFVGVEVDTAYGHLYFLEAGRAARGRGGSRVMSGILLLVLVLLFVFVLVLLFVFLLVLLFVLLFNLLFVEGSSVGMGGRGGGRGGRVGIGRENRGSI